MSVHDPDFSDEGELYVNGNGPLALFGDKASDQYDAKTVTLSYDTPANWWQDGSNSLKFRHIRTAGYRIESFSVNFTGGGGVSQATLSLNPSVKSLKVGDIFQVDIELDTKGNDTDGVDIHYLHYNPSLLKALSVQEGNLYPITDVKAIDNANGTIDFSQTTAGGTTFNGTGTVATVSFKALSKGTATLNFDFTPGDTTDSNVSKAGGAHEDILSAVSGATYTISGTSGPPRQKGIIIKVTPEALTSFGGFAISSIKVINPNDNSVAVSLSNVNVDAQGKTSFIDLSNFSDDVWNVEIKASHYLTKKISDVVLSSNQKETLVEANLLAGDLNDDDVINELDWGMMGSKWHTSDTVADINRDGDVNTLDWHYLNKNWGLTKND
jgi:hypothetical protein